MNPFNLSNLSFFQAVEDLSIEELIVAFRWINIRITWCASKSSTKSLSKELVQVKLPAVVFLPH